ncbi:MAG TPA: UDP-glucuronic acid decarboxylase family protein [archaeon]|nr:UDP-glucuronic acid decarboxylase family protein [archaeon]
MKIIVAGGAGFIGSHLCERLIEEENEVIALDNFCTGTKKNIELLEKNKNFSFLEHDIQEPLEIEEKISQVYNCASPASPVDFSKIPIEIMLTNSLGIKNLLDFCLEKKARFLQTSTSEVYGDPLEHPQKESYWGNVNPIGQRACYDEAKRFAEALIMSYKRAKNLEVRIARIFNTFGPRMRKDDGRAIPEFIGKALQNLPLEVFGSGKQTRSFCYVSDQVAGLIALMNSDFTGPVNIGNPVEITLLELAQKTIEFSGSKSKIVFKALPQDDPKKRKPDISLAREKLSWEPKEKWENGLKKTIEWFKKN